MNFQVDLEPAKRDTLRSDERATILVVERHECLRHIAREILERCGYRVLTAANGHEAKRILLGATTINLTLSDVAIPDGTGQELAFWCQTNRPGMQVVLMSDTPGPLCPPGLRTVEMPFIHLDNLIRVVREALGGRGELQLAKRAA